MERVPIDVNAIVAGIDSDDSEAFLGASELLRAYALGVDATGVIEPYATLHQANPLTTEQVDALSQALVAYIDSGRLHNAVAAIHALGQLRDPQRLPWLHERLTLAVNDFVAHGDLLGQTIIAMENCGATVVRGGAFSSREYEKNLADAQTYLSLHDDDSNP
ncbi:MAG: hypothetical protein AAF184_11760 [Pseudomonadota bacterium]